MTRIQGGLKNLSSYSVQEDDTNPNFPIKKYSKKS